MYKFAVGDCVEIMQLHPERLNPLFTTMTSIPYFGQRAYTEDGREIGRESTLAEYIEQIVEVFRLVHAYTHPLGTLWLNIGDIYNAAAPRPRYERTYSREWAEMRLDSMREQTSIPGLKNKDLVGLPWQVALAIRDSGWYLRSAIPWFKSSAMPSGVTDRPVPAHEYIFLFSKSESYYYDRDAIRLPRVIPRKFTVVEPPRYLNTGDWTANSLRTAAAEARRYADSIDEYLAHRGEVYDVAGDLLAIRASTSRKRTEHPAVYPHDIVEPCLRLTTPGLVCPDCYVPYAQCYTNAEDGSYAPCGSVIACEHVHSTPIHPVVFDPFCGSGTTVEIAHRIGASGYGIDINQEYITEAYKRMGKLK